MAKPQLRSLNIHDALMRLADTAITIQRRGRLKQSESKRVKEFITAVVLTQPGGVYEQFLRKVSDEAGLQMALLCSVALGRTAVKGMRERVRVDLPFEIKDNKTRWENSTLQNLVSEARGAVFNEQDDTEENPADKTPQENSTPAEIHNNHATPADFINPDLGSGMFKDLIVRRTKQFHRSADWLRV